MQYRLAQCIEGAAETVPPTPSSKALPTEESKGEDDTKSDDKVRYAVGPCD